jgi:hypothetical protein
LTSRQVFACGTVERFLVPGIGTQWMSDHVEICWENWPQLYEMASRFKQRSNSNLERIIPCMNGKCSMRQEDNVIVDANCHISSG